MPNKVDSNLTGLRIAKEVSLKTLPGTPDWYPYEPNSYNDFGGELTLLARNPINDSRQRLKGVITDLDAAGGFNTDLTQTNMFRLLEGFFFAPWTLQDNAEDIDSVDGTTEKFVKTGAFGGFVVGHLVWATGFTNAANNGLHRVTTVAANELTVVTNLTTEASPPATSKVKAVGFQSAAGDLDVDAAGANPALTSTALDFTTLGLAVGDWIWIGGDTSIMQFTNSANKGFARIYSIAATRLEFDVTQNTLVTEANAAQTVQIFFGDRINNATTGGGVVRSTYQLERSLSDGGFEYLVGAVPSTLQLNISQADKINLDLGFVACDHETRTVGTGAKTGNRPSLVEAGAFNTSSDFTRLRLRKVSDGTALFAFLTELRVTIDNNLSPNKAVSVLGAFDVSAGTFAVDGTVEAYFGDVTALEAVRNNIDVGLDFAVVKDNAGLIFDLPHIALGDGRLNVEQDQAIKLPLTTPAAKHPTLGYTMRVVSFDYLPDLAE